MKTTFFFTLIFSMIFFQTSAQENSAKKAKSETIQIKTSAVCGMCKQKIQSAVYDLKGVKSAELDLPTKTLTVTYKPSAVTPDEIRKAITEVGYDADEMKADSAAYDKLEKCCKKDAAPH
jgi:copper chaperone CopZ